MSDDEDFDGTPPSEAPEVTLSMTTDQKELRKGHLYWRFNPTKSLPFLATLLQQQLTVEHFHETSDAISTGLVMIHLTQHIRAFLVAGMRTSLELKARDNFNNALETMASLCTGFGNARLFQDQLDFVRVCLGTLFTIVSREPSFDISRLSSSLLEIKRSLVFTNKGMKAVRTMVYSLHVISMLSDLIPPESRPIIACCLSTDLSLPDLTFAYYSVIAAARDAGKLATIKSAGALENVVKGGSRGRYARRWRSFLLYHLGIATTSKEKQQLLKEARDEADASGLRVLDLSWRGIFHDDYGPKRSPTLSASLVPTAFHVRHLSHLTLAGNYLVDESIDVLYSFIMWGAASLLRTLDVTMNRLTIVGIDMLCCALFKTEKFPAFEHFAVFDNAIEPSSTPFLKWRFCGTRLIVAPPSVVSARTFASLFGYEINAAETEKIVDAHIRYFSGNMLFGILNVDPEKEPSALVKLVCGKALPRGGLEDNPFISYFRRAQRDGFLSDHDPVNAPKRLARELMFRHQTGRTFKQDEDRARAFSKIYDALNELEDLDLTDIEMVQRLKDQMGEASELNNEKVVTKEATSAVSVGLFDPTRVTVVEIVDMLKTLEANTEFQNSQDQLKERVRNAIKQRDRNVLELYHTYFSGTTGGSSGSDFMENVNFLL